MKRRHKIMLMLLGIICVIILFLSVISLRSVSSIGIIGAADGPTSIFISTAPATYILSGVGAVITIIAFIVICIVAWKKK